ncbi:hypothetical protein F4821DRAFT_269464 [Hypoxylon rubiginosum]|uniref:Uncharacterized protein n=1 Tax=Hypoxylon rubiginosum TaxID=110542 RepID=A0ACC0D3N0_9PEZI|nr:hypothetical protein F4821DRAFT_269464 [Hypoxylon rubiginosum]
MNRIGPSGTQLYVANADGSDAKPLMGNQSAPFDYHASWSPDGQWIVFTSERRADGQADLYRVKPDGTGLETLVQTDSFEDAGVLSPDGTKLTYVSTSGNYTANIWVKDLNTGISQNLTDTPTTQSNKALPQGHFRPAWSPDGEWIAFSSDRNTDWTGHSDGTGWEHTQTLSIYVIRPDGSDFRQVVSQPGYSLGTPQWSKDGSRIIYNAMTTEATYNAHGSSGQQASVSSQILSVDVATGLDVVAHASEASLKVGQQWIGNSTNIGYSVKAGASEGINYTSPDATHKAFNGTYLRNPSWSPDGSKLVYEVYSWDVREAGKQIFSWDSDWEYRFMDVFPQFNNATGRLAITQKQLGNSSVITSSPEYTELVDSFDVYEVGQTSDGQIGSGLGGAFQPAWAPDGSQLAVGLGAWFFARSENPAAIYVFNATGDGYTNLTLTNSSLNAGFPSYSPDGTKLVYRLWSAETGIPYGLRILDLETGETTNLTSGWDTTPGWSPDGERIVFARQVNWTAEYGSRWYADRYDVMTIRPDGSELTALTSSMANDAHAVWSYDGRIMYNSGMYGFRDECAQFDNTFQPYGQIMMMDADGSNKRMLTDSTWEDSMPIFIPNEFL